jgi:anti-anti-sigma factor
MTEIVRCLLDGRGTLVVTLGSALEDAVVCARGEFDLTNSARLAQSLAEQLRAGGRSVRLDLSGVSFVDATAISAIVQAQELYRVHHAKLVVDGQRGIVARVLAMSGICTSTRETPLSAIR